MFAIAPLRPLVSSRDIRCIILILILGGLWWALVGPLGNHCNHFLILILNHCNPAQARKRHWGCDACDTLFNSVLELEEHKEEMEHWSDDEYESDGEEEDDEDGDEEECDCGCSSPPRLLSSVGVGTEETVFTEQAREL